MLRNRLFPGVLAAAFALVLGLAETDAQAGKRRGHSRRDACCQNARYDDCDHRGRRHRHRSHRHRSHRHYSHRGACCQQTAYYGGYQQQSVNYGGCQPATYVTTNAYCNPAPTCCVVQTACATVVTPVTSTAPQTPAEPDTAPAPGNND